MNAAPNPAYVLVNSGATAADNSTNYHLIVASNTTVDLSAEVGVPINKVAAWWSVDPSTNAIVSGYPRGGTKGITSSHDPDRVNDIDLDAGPTQWVSKSTFGTKDWFTHPNGSVVGILARVGPAANVILVANNTDNVIYVSPHSIVVTGVRAFLGSIGPIVIAAGATVDICFGKLMLNSLSTNQIGAGNYTVTAFATPPYNRDR